MERRGSEPNWRMRASVFLGKRVARLMKEAGVEGVSRRRRTRTTHRKPGWSCRAPESGGS